MSDTTVWIIALAFYAPIHFLGPALVGFLTGPEPPLQRRRLLVGVFIDCGVSMLAAFAVAVPLFRQAPQYAALILLAAMFVPYLHIWIRHRRVQRRSA
jgi:hypothetical protein